MERLSLDISDVWLARKRIASLIKKTPLVKSTELSRCAGCPVYLKMETQHEIHAFKVRGAANKILSLNQKERARGVTTFSTGNHGMAVAWVASRLGIPAVICVSRRVPAAKTEALRRLEGLGVLEFRHGSGIYVGANAVRTGEMSGFSPPPGWVSRC